MGNQGIIAGSSIKESQVCREISLLNDSISDLSMKIDRLINDKLMSVLRDSDLTPDKNQEIKTPERLVPLADMIYCSRKSVDAQSYKINSISERIEIY